MPDIVVDVRGVHKLLSNIKPNKASGPDSIPCRVLKEAALELAPVLTDIFNSSLATSMLPKDWKTANIAPVFKKGNTNSAENYRPISLTCVCCKLLEHIVCHNIRDHLDNHNILSVFQHGFMAGHSCDSQLLSTVYDLMSIFEMSSWRNSAWFFQGLWCRPTSEAPWENQALRHQRYDPSLDQWLSEWTHTASCCRWVLFGMVYCSLGSATGHRTSPPSSSFYYILTTCQIASIVGSGCLSTIVWCTGKLATLGSKAVGVQK